VEDAGKMGKKERKEDQNTENTQLNSNLTDLTDLTGPQKVGQNSHETDHPPLLGEGVSEFPSALSGEAR
jgi:hypothetical protein